MNLQSSLTLLPSQNSNKPVDSSLRNSVALQLIGATVRSQTISFSPKSNFTDLGTALATVRDEWDYAQKHVRYGDVIDGRAMEPLLEAIHANRGNFPPGEFTIKVEWPDGASIETTIPPITGTSVRSVSISAVFAGKTSSDLQTTIASTSVQASYQEWR